MDDTAQIEEIIREIAFKHGIAVSRDDPILILQTINNRLLSDGAKAQQVMLDGFKAEMEHSALRWRNEAKENAEQILNAALGASKRSFEQSLEMMATSAANKVACEIDRALERVTRPVKAARHLAIFNLAAASLTLGGSALALWSILH
jgi:hypothetical protein